jgi:hypothetical protein
MARDDLKFIVASGVGKKVEECLLTSGYDVNCIRY